MRGCRGLWRLANAPKLPESIQVVSRAYRRNADVIAEVLHRANGICEHCHAQAPFQRESDSSPYLEVHHRIYLFRDEVLVTMVFFGLDSVYRKVAGR
jgi:hypothetical protein